MRRAASGRGSAGHRRARLGRRDRSHRHERHRRPDEPPARQARRQRPAHRGRARRGLSTGGHMTWPPGSQVARQSTRVALWATGLVALLYVIVSIVIVAWLTVNLTNQVDARLAAPCRSRRWRGRWRPSRRTERWSTRAPGRPARPCHPTVAPSRQPLPFGRERAIWFIAADGSVTSDRDDLELPAAYRDVTSPRDHRHLGDRAAHRRPDPADGHMVVGESMEPVDEARTSVVLGLLAHRAHPPAGRLPGLAGRRTAGGHAHRASAPASAGLHRRCLARAAHAALGHRGQRRAGAGRRSGQRLVPRTPSSACRPSRAACDGSSRSCSGWRGSTPCSSRQSASRSTSGSSSSRPPTASRPLPRVARQSLEVRMDAEAVTVVGAARMARPARRRPARQRLPLHARGGPHRGQRARSWSGASS